MSRFGVRRRTVFNISLLFLLVLISRISYTSARPRLCGVNYISKFHLYSSKYTTDETIHRDFKLFKQLNISVVALSLYWHHMEGDIRGSYSGARNGVYYGDKFLDDVKRVCNIASKHDLTVLLNVHTSWSENGSWCIPDYVMDPVTGKNIGLAIVRSEEMKEAFLEMFRYIVGYMSDDTPFYSWGLLNEPWYWPKTLDYPFEHIDQKENFIDLMLKQRDIVKTSDSKRKTHVKFVSDHEWQTEEGEWKIKNSFESSWEWDERIIQAVDFAGFDIYSPVRSSDAKETAAYDEFVEQWRNITSTNVLWFKDHGKRVWITETGSKGYPESPMTEDEQAAADETQRAALEFLVEYFASLPVETVIGWKWESDESNEEAEHGYPGRGYNLCRDTFGNSRSACLELAAFAGHSC